MGAGSGGGTPDRNSRSQISDTPDQGPSSLPQTVTDGQIQGASMFSDSLMSSILPTSASKVMPTVSDRWPQRAER